MTIAVNYKLSALPGRDSLRHQELLGDILVHMCEHCCVLSKCTVLAHSTHFLDIIYQVQQDDTGWERLK